MDSIFIGLAVLPPKIPVMEWRIWRMVTIPFFQLSETWQHVVIVMVGLIAVVIYVQWDEWRKTKNKDSL